MRRAVGVILIGMALLSIPSTNGAHKPAQRFPGASAHGCALYIGVPNPCDPDTNN